MIKISNIIKAAIGLVLMIAMIVFVSINRFFFGVGVDFERGQYCLLYVLSIGVFLLMLIDRRIIFDKLYKILAVVSIAAIPFILMQISMMLAGKSEYTIPLYMMNVFLYAIVIVVMFVFTNSLSVSATAAIVIGSLFNIASYVLNNLRGTPFIPTDLLALNTAVRVAGNYEFTLEWPLISAIVMSVFAIVLAWSFPIKIEYRHSRIINRCAAAGLFGIIAIVFSIVNFSNINIDVFDQYHANNTHGTAYSFFINLCKMKLEKPEDYNEADVEAMLASIKEDEPARDKTNVIVIMNESYSDLSVVGDFKTNIPYNKFFNSLEKNTVRGHVLVSPFGGYTCNSEFEFLSGLSMGLLQSGVTPYLQYINKKCTYFLPEYMNSLGYKTIALHPYYARCWNRETVYPLMGFDEFISIENMDDYQNPSEFESIRSYLSDNTSYSALIHQFEIKDDDERLFLFNVTMQNHGGYTFEGASFTNDVQITSMKGNYPQTEQYLSLLKRSDSAFELLIDYFKNYDEPTVIVMFGDHQPGIEQEFYEELYGKSLDELSTDELLRRYEIPFVIWTNYKQESKNDVETSLNYLSNYVMESANLPKSKIISFQDTVKDSVPIINASVHLDADGEWKSNDVKDSDALKSYADLEYYMLTHKPSDKDIP